MERCVNCGKKITPGQEVPLCARCSSCETILEAQKVKMQRDIWDGAKISIFLAVLATILVFVTDFERSNLAGAILYIYAALSIGFRISGNVANYIRLKEIAKKEMRKC